MANKFWVGGTGHWSDDTNHWATTTGDSPGARNEPTSAVDITFDSNSGTSATVAIDEAVNANTTKIYKVVGAMIFITRTLNTKGQANIRVTLLAIALYVETNFVSLISTSYN